MMNSLTELYQQDVAQLEAKVSEAKAKEDRRRASLKSVNSAHFKRLLHAWEPLRGLLGLKGEPTIDIDRELIEWPGATSINSRPVVTLAFMYFIKGDMPNLHIVVTDESDLRIAASCELSAAGAPGSYPEAIGRMCSIWMEHYQRTIAEDQAGKDRRLEHLGDAKRYIGLARVYVDRREQVADKVERWALEWSAKLWQPHKLWRVRYVPVGSLVEEDTEAETIIVMEEPGDIITALREGLTATVTKVGVAGDVAEMEIPSFLDAQVLIFDEYTAFLPMAYHARYPAGPYVVNVPPFCGCRPAPAPSSISWRSYLGECEVPAWVGDIDPATLAAMETDEFVEGYGWLME